MSLVSKITMKYCTFQKKNDAGDHRPTFEETGVPSKLVEILAQNGIREPTELEFEILLGFAEGKQMVIKAPPKSGKSFSHMCAVVSQISLKPAVCIETVIVTETAAQAKSIHDLMMCLGSFYPINYLLCDDRTVTLESTKAVFGNKQVQLVIGTADRLLKVLPENNCDMDKIRLMIIDNIREACTNEETDTDYLSRLCNRMGNRMLQQVIIGDEFSPDQWIRLTSEQSMDRPHTSIIKNVRPF
ncbi:hypothetical protein RvY_13654-2 [Ramazzottius varieornatus]|uniref:DEAD/DEAH-box helicase domain-containing protein n=1 Tax=Ramazzottius varieornatus TaxID=947166 RepID=A0A1D1VSP5_RAMVA|nr:hypothetical protein RvY_13654-2 [Ramazzottius varieornatus]